MTRHVILSQFASYLKPLYNNQAADYYHLTRINAAATHRKHHYHDESLCFTSFANPDAASACTNAALVQRAHAIQADMPQGTLVVPCQWDEHANPGQAPAKGSNIIVMRDVHDDQPNRTVGGFLMVMPNQRTDTTNLYNIKTYCHDHLVPSLFPVFEAADQVQEVQLHHPAGDMPKRFFPHGLYVPLHVAMHDAFLAQTAELGRVVGAELTPPNVFALLIDNLRAVFQGGATAAANTSAGPR